jgi:hypothetical protein
MKLKWVIGGVIALAVTLVILAWPAKSLGYDFLNDYQPVPLTRQDADFSRLIGVNRVVYTFTADWKVIVQRARDELAPRSWKESCYGTDLAAFYYPSEGVARNLAYREHAWSVTITRDLRYEQPSGMPAQGWVTVMIDERGEPSFWEKARSMFGL